MCVLDKKKEKRAKGAEEVRGRRNAIRLSREYTVETVVVADANMVQYHGAEAAQRFLLTVMNMVSPIPWWNATVGFNRKCPIHFLHELPHEFCDERVIRENEML